MFWYIFQLKALLSARCDDRAAGPNDWDQPLSRQKHFSAAASLWPHIQVQGRRGVESFFFVAILPTELSDLALACRNYQRRFRCLRPPVTLQEWQLNNCRTGKRFANVLKDFRSHRSNFWLPAHAFAIWAAKALFKLFLCVFVVIGIIMFF